MILETLRKLSAYIQQPHSSFKRHNAELESETAFETEKAIGLERLTKGAINDPELRINDLLKQHPHIKTAVDIGSGAGWGSAAVSSMVRRVIAIEPSEAGIAIAKKVYIDEQYKNIEWNHGFAEDVLQKISITEPAVFFTGCVFSHLRDTEVIKICAAVNKVSLSGSILSFAECWGDQPWHQLMWHVRTKDWWQEQFPSWELTFHGPQVEEKDEYKGIYHKGFWGVKK